MVLPGEGYYKGPNPYVYGHVDLEDGVQIASQFTESDPDKLKIGMDVEMIIEKLFDHEEGNEVMTFKFKPI